MDGKKLAKDIMTTEVITVKTDDSVEKAARLLLEHNISGLPVVDNGERLVGIVSEGDLVLQEKNLRAPAYTVLLGGIIYLEDPRRFDEELRRTIALKVEELMTKKVYTVGPDTPLGEIASIMVKRNVNRVPVVTGDKKLLGIISRHDILRATHGG